jgi:hypothetical protein
VCRSSGEADLRRRHAALATPPQVVRTPIFAESLAVDAPDKEQDVVVVMKVVSGSTRAS